MLNWNSKEVYMVLVRRGLQIFSLGLFFLGLFLDNKNIALTSVLIIFLLNLVSSFFEKKDGYVYYVLFQCFIFLFIISRPCISMLTGFEWWYFQSYTIYTSLFILLLSLIALDVGFNYKNDKNSRKSKKESTKIEWKKIETPLFVLSIFTLACSLVKEVLNMIYFYGDYASIYTGKTADIPFIINVISGLSLYFMIFYLACMPNKKKVMYVLSLYIFTGIPGIIVGGRNALMIKILFAFIYFVLRQSHDSHNKWIGKKEKISLLILIPIFMLLLGAMNYTRESQNIPTSSPIKLMEDFLYKQGTSYDTLCQTIEYRNELRNDTYISYTFGEPIDFILHNRISNKLFGTEHFNGNSIENATKSNNLAHRVSYLVLGEKYLEGHGRGTTYFSELYLDFGYLGILVFNLLLGMLFKYVNTFFGRGFYSRVLILNGAVYIYMIPRLAAFSIISFMLNYYFWITCICVVMLIKLKGRKKNG